MMQVESLSSVVVGLFFEKRRVFFFTKKDLGSETCLSPFAHLGICYGDVPSNPRVHVDDAVAAKHRQTSLGHHVMMWNTTSLFLSSIN